MQTEHQLRPRRGPIGLVDIIFGPGATGWEVGLALVAGLFGAATTCWYAATTKLEWTSLQYAVAAVIAFDIFGGAVANSTMAQSGGFIGRARDDWRSSPSWRFTCSTSCLSVAYSDQWIGRLC